MAEASEVMNQIDPANVPTPGADAAALQVVDQKPAQPAPPVQQQVTLPSSQANQPEQNYIATAKARTIADMKARSAGILSQANNPTQDPQKAPETAQPQDPTDKLGIRPLKIAGSIAYDVARGTVQAPAQAVGGVEDAWNNAVKGADSLATWLNTKLPLTPQNEFDPHALEKVFGISQDNVVDKADTVTGNLVRGTAEFLAGFIPALRGMRALTGAAEVGTFASAAQSVVAGGIGAGIVLDPQESRLSNLIQDSPLANPVTDYLQAKPGDTAAEGRLKNTLEGLGLGVVAEGLVGAVKLIRSNRQIEREAAGFTQQRDLGEGAPPIPSGVGEPTAAFMPKETVEAIRSGKATLDEATKDINWAQLQTPEAINQALSRLDRISKMPLESSGAVKVAAIDEAAGGRPGQDTNLNPTAKVTPRLATVSDAEAQSLSRKLGLDVNDFLGKMQFMNGNKAIDVERVIGANRLLDAATEKTIDLAKVASESSDEGALLDFLRMSNIQAGIQQHFRGFAAEAGRSLRAFQLPVGSRAKQLEALNELIGQGGGHEEVRRLAGAVSELRDPELAAKAIREMTAGQKVQNSIAQVWYFQLLSNPVTHAANMVSNALNTVYAIPARKLASTYSNTLGNGGTASGESTAMVWGMVNSMGDALRSAGRTFATGVQGDLAQTVADAQQRLYPISAANYGFTGAPGSMGWLMGKASDGLAAFFKGDTANAIQQYGAKQAAKSNLAVLADTAGGLFGAPTRLLMSADEFFRTINKSMQMHALSYRQAVLQEGLQGDEAASRMLEILRNPPDSIVKASADFGRDQVFATPLGRAGQGIQSWTNEVPAMKAILPFLRTPVNITKEAGRNSPFAPLSSQFRDAIAAGGHEGDLALAKMALGSMLGVTMMDQVWKGNVTGAGPANDALYQTWRRDHQPFSVKLGGTWYSYNRADPFGLMAGAMASFAEISSQTDDPELLDSLATMITSAAARSVLNKSYMQGPTQFLDAVHDPEVAGRKWVDNFAGTTVVPGLAAQVARVNDPVWRDVQGILDAIKARTPGLSKDLPARVNLWGEPIHLEGALGPDIISPIYTQHVTNDPVDKLMEENQTKVDLPARSQDGIKLTPQEYHDFAENAGKGAKAQLDQMAPALSTMTKGPDGIASTTIKAVVADHRTRAWGEMMARPEIAARSVASKEDKAYNLGVGPGKPFSAPLK